MENYNQIDHIKSLSNSQYEAIKSTALKRTKNSLGDKPTRKKFKREFQPLLGILDYFAIVVFLAAFCASSLHIIGYIGSESQTSYFTAMGNVLGIQVDKHSYGWMHQASFILMAEFSMLLFSVMARTRKGIERWLSLILAVFAGAFVILANVSSGLNGFLSILAPCFVIGLSIPLDGIIAKTIERNQDIDNRYRQALAEYELITNSPEKSSVYRQHLANEIIQKLASLKANENKMNDLTPDDKRLLVTRELERESWMNNLDLPVPTNSFLPTLQTHQNNSNGHNKIVKMNLEQ